MKAKNLDIWIQLSKDKVIRKDSIDVVFFDKHEKKYYISISGALKPFNKDDGEKILRALHITP